ncbi:MAG: hypothetical protein AABX68_01905 [Nanoarchaeota archaeon]
MLKRGVLFLFICVLIINISFISAQNETDIISEAESEYPDAELQTEAGTTPDNFFYFFDKFFDRFGDDLKVREERIAEIREMIQQGKIEEAREALERYLTLADKLEKEIDPEKRDEARRGAVAIRRAIAELESEIPEEFREEFVNNVLEREGAIVTSVEISSKIKELCETLSGLDPLEYSRVCRTEKDNPEWQKKIDRKLTDEQREEAIKFGKIMSQCFKTSGQQCRCEEIPFTEFAEMCSIAASLAVQCETEGNEDACEKLDNLEMPELPPHLQDVFDSLEGDIVESQIELHMPRECREAGATSPKECTRIMIQTNAPEECRDALLEANPQNEREAREICEKIMFELNAPEECIEKGLTNPKECGKLMFQLNAPQECLDAGLTGESRGDEKKCRVIMEGSREGREQGFKGSEGGFGGANCRGITDSEERLRCYDSASQGAREYNEERRGEEPQGEWPEPCQQANTLTKESCEQIMKQFGEQQRQEFIESQPGQEFKEPSSTTSGEGTTTTTTTTTQTEPATSESPITSNEGTTSDSLGTITGSVIRSNNDFFNYYFK